MGHELERPYYTRSGYERLLARIVRAREDYLEVCRSNEEAAGAGDSSVWHDNFAYEENQRRMHQLATRVRELEDLARRARIVDGARPESVAIGCRVRVRIDDEREVSWAIAGYDDGDPELGRISYVSPLGRALIGATRGEIVDATIDKRVRELEVLEISVEEVA